MDDGLSDDGLTDARLVAEHLAGNRQVFGAIYDRYAGQLYDTAAAMLGDEHEAADATHDVFVTAARSMAQLRDPSRLRAWLFAILRHDVYRRTAKRRRSRPTDLSAAAWDRAAEVSGDHDSDADRSELAGLVRAAASGLDARDQLVLELSARQSLSGDDLADALGVSVAQSYVLVHRMRDRMARSLGALTIARMGQRDCVDLAGVLRGWDGTFSVLVRKRVARHIDGCEVCEENRRRWAVAPMMATAPAFAAPAGLRDRVLASVGGASAPPPPTFAASTGFPIGAGMRRRLAAIIAVAAVVLLTIGVTIAVASGDDTGEAPTVAPATNGAPSSSAAPTSSTTTPTSTPTTSTPTSTSTSTTTSTSSTTAPPLPVLRVVTDTVDLGATVGSGDITIENIGDAPMPFTVVGNGVAPFVFSPASGEIAPGGSTSVRVSLDRTGQAEGDLARDLSVRTEVGSEVVLLRASVEHPPVVTLVRALRSVTCNASPTVSVTVADESTIRGVVATWIGPGPTGTSAMTERSGGWIGRVGPLTVNGTWAYTVTATDVRGNVGSLTGIVIVTGC